MRLGILRRAAVGAAVGAAVATALTAGAPHLGPNQPQAVFAASVTAEHPEWVGAWARAPMGAGESTTTVQGKGFDNQTIRNIAHVATGGKAVRFELSNTFGDTALQVAGATVALRTEGGAIASQTIRKAAFDGHRNVTVAPGASVMSDPINFAVEPGDDLAVSIYLPEPTGRTTWHRNTHATSYISTAGDHTRDRGDDAFTGTTSKFYLTALDVRGSGSNGTVVALGDSITAGAESTVDANHRYPDFLATRLLNEPSSRRLTVINEGIGGNRLLTDFFGASWNHESGQARFDRDVLSRTSVRTVVMLFGANDFFNEYANGEPATADDLIKGTTNILARAHAHGIRVVVGTVPPMGGYPAHTEDIERHRQAFNAWVRECGEPDGVADVDAVLRDPDDPSRIASELDSGDHLHPNDDGYRAMADVIDLRQLQGGLAP